MRILLKYPTRQRPDLFRSTLREYIDTANGPMAIVVTIDQDDRTMNHHEMHAWILAQGASYHVNPRRGKITAINAHIPADGWDILVLASDDHLPEKMGWDTAIKEDMPADLDAMLWYKEIKQDRICLMPILGKTYYDRFGYIYHPEYISLWCDNEQTEVAKRLGKLIQSDVELFRNESPDWGGTVRRDHLYRVNNNYFHKDHTTYRRRERRNFDLQ